MEKERELEHPCNFGHIDENVQDGDEDDDEEDDEDDEGKE